LPAPALLSTWELFTQYTAWVLVEQLPNPIATLSSIINLIFFIANILYIFLMSVQYNKNARRVATI